MTSRYFTMGWILAFSTMTGCLSQKFTAPQKLGGKWVSSKTLNLGHDTYMNYCMQCHGMQGDGVGPASLGLYPQPRDFRQGVFKFGSVTSGELPTDEDLKHTVRYGLRGTPMLPWDISDERLDAVVQYIKTFSPVWKDQTAGTPQKLSKDPWGPNRASEAIALGKRVYHGMAQCYTCHPSYAPLSFVDEVSREMTGNGVAAMRADPDLSILQDSSYGHKFMPPDFTKIDIKTGGDVPSLYKVLGTGVGGTSMPSWKGMLSPSGNEEEAEARLWALAYYVNSLHKLKYNWEARKSFFEELNTARRSDRIDGAPSVSTR